MMSVYDEIEQKIRKHGFEVMSKKIIQNGIQISIKNCGHLRIYERKNGQITIDLSQIRPSCVAHLDEILNESNWKEMSGSLDDDLEIQRKVLSHLPMDPEMILPTIGSDEAGKGDIFGPIVVAAVYIGKVEYTKFSMNQLRDSKLLSDKKVLYLADQIKSLCDFSVKLVEPKDLVHFENINRLLEDLHAQCIRDVLKKRRSLIAIYDDFGAKNLKDKLSDFENLAIFGFKKAEKNPAVAAASIVARAEFLLWIDRVSKYYGTKIPLGAGQKAILFAKDFLKDHGQMELEKVAKVNFSNVQELLSEAEG